MTHPRLGYTNFRFDGDDVVHMAAFNGAGHIIACNAEGPTEHDVWPYGVDAPVDCESCARARLADWWMAQAEQQRREGAEAVWPETTSGELHDAFARELSQVNARVEAAILGTGERATPMLGVLNMDDPASPSVVHDADAMQLLAERLKDPVQDVLQAVSVSVPRMLEDHLAQRQDDARQARYLAQSPLSHLASDAGRGRAPEEILFGSTSMLPPVGGFTGRRLGLSPEEEAEDPDFVDEVEFTHGGTVVDDRDEYDYPDVVVPSDIDTLPEPSNWCHVHNRTTEAGREECSECDDERGEDQKAGES